MLSNVTIHILNIAFNFKHELFSLLSCCRSYEIISLLYKALHEKERLRLNCVKRERLQVWSNSLKYSLNSWSSCWCWCYEQKREQILRSSIQESEALKLKIKKTSLLAGEGGSCDDHQCSTQSENKNKVGDLFSCFIIWS